jgi:carbon storage regulator
MLVLSRKIGEKIHVGNDITIEVRRVAGNRVTLAVEAPRQVRILRGELREAAMEFEVDEAPRSPETVVISHPRLSPLSTMPHAVG